MGRSAEPEGSGAVPFATYALIVAQMIVWLVVRRYLLAGDDWTALALRPGTPSELGFLISPFVHIEPAHLGINMAVLWLVGVYLERATGSLRFLLLYLGAAWFASLMHWAAAVSFHRTPDLSSAGAAIGASGAIAGLLGAAVVRMPRLRGRLPLLPGLHLPALPILLVWLGYTLLRALAATVTGATEGVGHWAHFAGFIFGLGAAQAMGLQRAARREFLTEAAEEAAARGDLRAATQAWSALLAQRPEEVGIRSALIAARAAQGDLPGARRLAREGLAALVRAEARAAALRAYADWTAQLPDLDLPPGVRYRIGCWLADAGEDERAFRALWESLRDEGATPAAAGALFRAGQLALERLRSPLHARAAWERLLEQFPDSPWSDPAREALRRLGAGEGAGRPAAGPPPSAPPRSPAV